MADERLGGVRVWLKRDDLIDAVVTGNKWRKLRYLLPDAQRAGAATLLTFGGAYSNHVRAVAAAGRRYGFATVGVIRGEERPTNPALKAAAADGMQLYYLDRATYRRKHAPDVLDALRRTFGDFYLVPEGGTTVHAVRGCAEAIGEIDVPFDTVVCPVGTGGTLAGLAAGLGPGQDAIGFSVLRGARSLDGDVDRLHREALGRSLGNWRIDHRFHCGGFARSTPALAEFCADFGGRHGFTPDRVYVGKMLYGLFRMVADGELPAGRRVVALITGSEPGPTSAASIVQT
ncbi:MAG: 1-aminocyclopropane-1-carboxylate deaminase/D-cysteine desulfhydrase [Pseudonocardia sp.]